MKHLINCVLLLLIAFQLHAQEKHFLFLQSESRQPFYVSLNGKIYSSSASGYVIIPKLQEGDYNFTIGFAQGGAPEQSFHYSLTNKDAGFTLKNFGEKGWGLFNLQSLAVTMAGEVNNTVSVQPRVKEETIISFDKKPAPKRDTIAAGSTPTVVNTVVDTTQLVNKPVSNTLPAIVSAKVDSTKLTKVSTVNKISETAAPEQVSLVFEDKGARKKDTIHVVIPTADEVEEKTKTADSNNQVVVLNPEVVSAAPATKPAIKFLHVDTTQADVSKTEASPILNSNCKAQATDEDYTKLRRRMAQEATDEKMMAEATKFYQRKCFSTTQIKSLSTLFLSDEGRYNFFIASLNFVTDPDQYASLSAEFIDPQFSTRFKSFLNQ